MYLIKETSAQNSAGNWEKPVFNWADLKSKNFGGIYVLAHKPIKDGNWRLDDNKNLGPIRDDVVANNMRIGLFTNPDGINVSYAVSMMDLASKVGVQNDKHLPSDATDSLLPCVMLSSFPAGYKVNQIEGDLFTYFNSIILAKYANVVLCLNKATADVLVNSKSKLILDTLALPSVRIWYYRPGPGITATQIDAELYATPAKKHVWIAGTAIGASQANWAVPTPPAPVCLAGEHYDEISKTCVKDTIPPTPTPATKWQRVAAIIREFIPLFEKLAKEVEKTE